MKIATLICIVEGEIDGDVESFNIDEGKEIAIQAWKDRIRSIWDSDSEEEILSRIEDGIIEDYSYDDHSGTRVQLFWSELGGSLIPCEMFFQHTLPQFKDDEGKFRKIPCIKVFREVTGADLLSAKLFTEGTITQLTQSQISQLSENGIYVKRV